MEDRVMELKTTANPIDNASVAKQVVSNLFYGWGYNFYRRENQLRADDLLIRSKVSDLLGECRAHLSALEASYRREHLPPPTREKPFPDAAAVATVQAMQRAAHDIENIETAIRTAPVPEMDRIHQRHRNERDTLEQLANVDSDIVLSVVMLRDAIGKLSDATKVADDVTQLLNATGVRDIWKRREQVLSVLTE
jgi:hypothetical protein